jgi:membrane fusion protein, multidrug efflux system
MNKGRVALLVVLAAGAITLLVMKVGGSGGDGEEEISPDVAVHVEPIVRGTLHRYVTAYGTVEPEPAIAGHAPAGAVISPIVGGVLTATDVVDGQRVDRGTVLFRLDSRLAEVAAQKARQDVAFAEQAFQRQEELLRSGVTSQKAFRESKQRLDDARTDLSAAETQLAYHRITSPLAGTVIRINARVGQSVDPGTVLASVVDLSRLVVSANVASREAAGLKPGQRVILGPDSTAGRGTLTLVGRDVDPANDTYRVMATAPPGSGLTPGTFTDIRIEAEERPNVLLVPVASLVTRPGQGSWLMVIRGDTAVRTAVTPGVRDRGMVEVSGDGLTEGVMVVTVEAYSLPPRTKIRVVGR